MEGYAAITEASRANTKWVRRNADVLLQLLQSGEAQTFLVLKVAHPSGILDEPQEVLVVKKALVEHLDMDPRVTLSVLCDQLAPPEEDMDEEEQAIRVRLRSLVLLFLTGEAKQAIVERHALPGSGVEDILLRTSFVVRHAHFSDLPVFLSYPVVDHSQARLKRRGNHRPRSSPLLTDIQAWLGAWVYFVKDLTGKGLLVPSNRNSLR